MNASSSIVKVTCHKSFNWKRFEKSHWKMEWIYYTHLPEDNRFCARNVMDFPNAKFSDINAYEQEWDFSHRCSKLLLYLLVYSEEKVICIWRATLNLRSSCYYQLNQERVTKHQLMYHKLLLNQFSAHYFSNQEIRTQNFSPTGWL